MARYVQTTLNEEPERLDAAQQSAWGMGLFVLRKKPDVLVVMGTNTELRKFNGNRLQEQRAAESAARMDDDDDSIGSFGGDVDDEPTGERED